MKLNIVSDYPIIIRHPFKYKLNRPFPILSEALLEILSYMSKKEKDRENRAKGQSYEKDKMRVIFNTLPPEESQLWK